MTNSTISEKYSVTKTYENDKFFQMDFSVKIKNISLHLYERKKKDRVSRQKVCHKTRSVFGGFYLPCPSHHKTRIFFIRVDTYVYTRELKIRLHTFLILKIHNYHVIVSRFFSDFFFNIKKKDNLYENLHKESL